MTGRDAWLAGGGEMGERIRAHDWAASPQGAPDGWPHGLRIALRLMLATRHPMFIFWGDKHICLYNDAYSASLGPEKHPAILGAPGREAWSEIWDIIGPQIDQVMRGDGTTWHVNQLVPIFRHGAIQDVYWTYNYGPIDDEDAPTGVGGVLVVCTETTEQVLTERRVRASEARESLLVRLLQGQRETDDPLEMMAAAAAAVGTHLEANRVSFFEVRDDETFDFDAGVSWIDGVLAPLSGTFPATGFGSRSLEEARKGGTFCITDTLCDPLTSDSRAGEIGARAIIGAPILRGGRRIASLHVHQADVRHWTDEEVSLVRFVADQTWEAVERAWARTALRDREARFRAIVQNVRDYAILGLDPDGFVTEWTEGAERLKGYTAEEVIGKHVSMFYTPEDIAEGVPERELGRAAATGRAEREAWRVRKGGGRFWANEIATALRDESGKLVGFTKISRDLTERRQAEEALRAGEERFRSALEIDTVGVVFFDLKGDITDANDSFLRMIGFSREDLESGRLRWDELTPPEWLERTRQDVEDLGTTGQSAPYEKEYFRKDGSRRWGLFAGKTLGDGVVVEFVLDITDRKRAEDERETFAATAAHDLKTPLTALRGQAQLMLRRSRLGRLGEGPALETGLGAIDAAVGRMVALVDEMMDAAHLRAGRTLDLVLAPVDLVALAIETAGEIGQGAPRHAVRVESGEPEISGAWDRARLRRVLGNLLGNAVKYSPLGGDVVIQIGREGTSDGEWAVLSVIDYGLGIPAEDLPRVFEPWHRGGNVGRIGGTGIGLLGARRIVEQHGGTISVTSAEGDGATFTVRLPLKDESD